MLTNTNAQKALLDLCAGQRRFDPIRSDPIGFGFTPNNTTGAHARKYIRHEEKSLSYKPLDRYLDGLLTQQNKKHTQGYSTVHDNEHPSIDVSQHDSAGFTARQCGYLLREVIREHLERLLFLLPDRQVVKLGRRGNNVEQPPGTHKTKRRN